MFFNKKHSIKAIKSRLIALGANIEVDKQTNKLMVGFGPEEHDDMQWMEIGFLLGQWALLVGVEYPGDFFEGSFVQSRKLRFDVDPGGMYFLFPK